MPDQTRTIPFSAAQRSSIRMTALLMLPVGAILAATGIHRLIELLPMLKVLLVMPLLVAVPGLRGLLELALGACLLVAAFALLSVARVGTVDALLRGMRALWVVYMVKATLLLLVATGVLLAFVLPMVT